MALGRRKVVPMKENSFCSPNYTFRRNIEKLLDVFEGKRIEDKDNAYTHYQVDTLAGVCDVYIFRGSGDFLIFLKFWDALSANKINSLVCTETGEILWGFPFIDNPFQTAHLFKEDFRKFLPRSFWKRRGTNKYIEKRDLM